MANSLSSSRSSQEISQVYSLFSIQLKRLSKQSRLSDNDSNKISRNVLHQLFQSFQRYPHYSWGEEMLPLFKQHFQKDFDTLWRIDKQKFYQILSDSCNSKSKPFSSTYQRYFYDIGPVKVFTKKAKITESTSQIKALNSSIMNESDAFPFIMQKKTPQHQRRHNTVSEIITEQEQNIFVPFNFRQNEDENFQIQKSSVLIPQTVFVERLNQQSREKISQMLDLYKSFSNSLQMMIKTVSILSCPLKHFEASLKRKIKRKKISKTGISENLLANTREAAILRKNKEYNNCLLLVEIKDFIDAYTEFLWKYLDLYQMNEGQLGEIITLETASGIVLKVVWSFAGWIGERGSQWEQMQLPKMLIKFDKIPKSIKIPQEVIKLTCSMSGQTNPQKYLKKIVIIYRQLSRICQNADQLLSYYEKLIFEVIRRNSHHRIFRMQSIIEKLMKMEDLGGEIGYAWTTWNIIIQFLKKGITEEEKQLIKAPKK